MPNAGSLASMSSGHYYS